MLKKKTVWLCGASLNLQGFLRDTSSSLSGHPPQLSPSHWQVTFGFVDFFGSNENVSTISLPVAGIFGPGENVFSWPVAELFGPSDFFKLSPCQWQFFWPSENVLNLPVAGGSALARTLLEGRFRTSP